MNRRLAQLVWKRAEASCEYCRMPQAFDEVSFEIDHVLPAAHGGATRAANLALACWYCNCHKGANLTGIDPSSRRIARLFNPRVHKWAYHFLWDGPHLVGRTASGRATIRVLRINHVERVERRRDLIASRFFPTGETE